MSNGPKALGLSALMNNTTSTATSKSSDDNATSNANAPNGEKVEADPVPKTGWALFLDMLRHESATPILVDVKEFVQRFPPNLDRQAAAKRIHRFLSDTQDKMMSECIVFMADCDEQGVSNAGEGIEKFVLKQLYSQIFYDQELEEEDKKLHRHIGCLRWIDFYHLEVPAIDPLLLELGIYELKRMNCYKAPRDKLVCILNACRVIGNVLKKENASRPASADDFLPLLIYSLLQANPPNLISNLEYVATFRHPDRMIGEEAYFFTALSSAMEFVKDVGPDRLSIGKEEFDRNVKEAGEALDEDAKRPQKVEGPKKTPLTHLSAATCEHLRMELSSLPLKYEAVENSKNIRVREVRHMLEEYRRMARIIRFVKAEVGS